MLKPSGTLSWLAERLLVMIALPPCFPARTAGSMSTVPRQFRVPAPSQARASPQDWAKLASMIRVPLNSWLGPRSNAALLTCG